MSVPVTENRLYDITIDGVSINKLAEDLKDVQTVEDLQALNIFVHRSGQTKTDDETEVMARVETFNGTFIATEMSFAHTNGVITHGVGNGSIAPGSTIGVGFNEVGGVLILDLNPVEQYWISMDTLAKVKTLRVYTNIVANDASTDFDPGAIACWYSQGYQSASNGVSSGQRLTLNFYKTVGNFNSEEDHPQTHAVSGGTLNSPPHVGDTGTMYGEVNVADGFDDLTDEELSVGANVTYNNKYWIIFAIQIPAAAVTKTYKFRFELDYEVL